MSLEAMMGLRDDTTCIYKTYSQTQRGEEEMLTD